MLCSIVGAQIRSLQSDPNADRDCEREKQQQRSRASAAQLAHPTALLENPLVLLTFWHLATHVSRNLTLEQRASGAPLCRSMVQDHLDCHIDAPLQTPPRWSHHCRRHLGPPIGPTKMTRALSYSQFRFLPGKLLELSGGRVQLFDCCRHRALETPHGSLESLCRLHVLGLF